jgi:alpha-glucosidase
MMNQLVNLVMFGVLATLISACNVEPDNEVRSPGRVNTITFELKDGVPHYAVNRKGSAVVELSRLGFDLQDQPGLSGNFAVESIQKSAFDETWTQVWGEAERVRNHYNEMRVNLIENTPDARRLSIVFRAFDDGVGFRYEFPEQPNLTTFAIMDEHTEFQLTGDHTSWWIGAYQWNRFEYFFQETPLSAVDTVHTPFTLRSSDGLYMSLHEAALVDYSTMTLEHTGNYKLKANLMPWSTGVLVYAEAPFVTPWRTIQLSDTPGGLIPS